MSIYATLSPTQIEYVVGHADPAVVVLEGTDQLARWDSVLAGGRHNIKKVIVIDDEATPESELFLSWSHLASAGAAKSEENPSELQSLMRISYAVFCFKKKRRTSSPLICAAREEETVSFRGKRIAKT